MTLEPLWARIREEFALSEERGQSVEVCLLNSPEDAEQPKAFEVCKVYGSSAIEEQKYSIVASGRLI